MIPFESVLFFHYVVASRINQAIILLVTLNNAMNFFIVALLIFFRLDSFDRLGFSIVSNISFDLALMY
jgi:hypothetical protein